MLSMFLISLLKNYSHIVFPPPPLFATAVVINQNVTNAHIWENVQNEERYKNVRNFYVVGASVGLCWGTFQLLEYVALWFFR